MSSLRRASSAAPCLDDVSKSILAELLGTSPSLLPEIEPDPEALAFLKAFASHADIHTKIAKAEIEHASLLKTHYHFEGNYSLTITSGNSMLCRKTNPRAIETDWNHEGRIDERHAVACLVRGTSDGEATSATAHTQSCPVQME